MRSRAAGKTPITLCPLDHAPVSGSSQVSNTLISIWKLTEQVQQALHGKCVSLFANLKITSHLKSVGMKNTTDYEPYRTKMLTLQLIVFIFLVTDPISYPRLTGIILAIPSKFRRQHVSIVTIQLWCVQSVLVRGRVKAPRFIAMHAEVAQKEKPILRKIKK